MSNARFSILQARAVRDTRITDSQFRTLAALGMYADADGWCFPLLSTLGKDLGKSKQAVGRDTIALRKLGYLEVRNRFDESGYRRSSLYRLKFDLESPCQPGVDSPSTSGVDSPSTSGVDVNDPVNAPVNPGVSFPEPTPTKKKGDLVDGLLSLSQAPGIKRQARVDAILSVLAERLHVRTTGRRWEEFAKLVDDRQQNFGEKLDVFLEWLVNQKGFNPQFWPPDRMGQFWPQAFVAPTTKPIEYFTPPKDDGEYISKEEAKRRGLAK